eukprot:COSAG02_NODE_1870_length_10588_cov_78.982652_8_plen_189_part_00
MQPDLLIYRGTVLFIHSTSTPGCILNTSTGTGFLVHKSEHSITAEWPLFPPSDQKTDALSVLSRPSPSPEAVGPKSDQWVLQGHFATASVGGLRSGPTPSGLEGRERGRLSLGLWPVAIGKGGHSAVRQDPHVRKTALNIPPYFLQPFSKWSTQSCLNSMSSRQHPMASGCLHATRLMPILSLNAALC